MMQVTGGVCTAAAPEMVSKLGLDSEQLQYTEKICHCDDPLVASSRTSDYPDSCKSCSLLIRLFLD